MLASPPVGEPASSSLGRNKFHRRAVAPSDLVRMEVFPIVALVRPRRLLFVRLCCFRNVVQALGGRKRWLRMCGSAAGRMLSPAQTAPSSATQAPAQTWLLLVASPTSLRRCAGEYELVCLSVCLAAFLFLQLSRPETRVAGQRAAGREAEWGGHANKLISLALSPRADGHETL